ncbi:MAG: hydroxyisourate hydrolase [Microbacteriaceae bacterium]|nr:hydroxyisourate hydrolase [Microbacteriaceae bacterium]
MSFVTTHVLDAATGAPAAGVPVWLHDEEGGILALGLTDADGRLADLGPDALPNGVYTIVFDTAELSTFYPNVTITFRVDGGKHYHVPLLLSPFAYSTYRGS